MLIATAPPTFWPRTIREVNALPEAQKHAVYRTLLPDWLLDEYGIDYATLTRNGQPLVQINAPSNSRVLEMSLFHHVDALDPVIYVNIVDTFNNQIMVLLLVINDPESPRFDIDRDEQGQPTQLGVQARNIPAEIAAMEAGLAPGQIRAGLRSFKLLVPIFEDFIKRLGHDTFFIAPLAYHNAITFERYGFSYLSGRKAMEDIHQRLLPGGDLHARLDGSTPFRPPTAWQSIRMRSWAIHDGILGYPFTGFQMYKRLGIHAGVNTFPGGHW